MADWCRWDNEADAKACLDAINGSKLFPIVGVNSKTLAVESTKQQTIRWDVLHECTDGKFGFQKPDVDMMKKLELDESIFAGSETEAFDSSWMAAEK